MLICKCPNPLCRSELRDFEKVQGRKLRDFDRVVIVDDKVISTNKQLTKVTKKLSDFLEDPERFEFNQLRMICLLSVTTTYCSVDVF